MTMMAPLSDAVLPFGVRSCFVDGVNGLRMHVLEAGFETGGQPCVLLLHGFPELAYSWRKVMAPLAAAGFHVIAPDQRGYGRTNGHIVEYDESLSAFRMPNLITDLLTLISALGHQTVAAVVGHDFGSYVAAWCALIRPDIFHSVVLMSSPFSGAPALPASAISAEQRPQANSTTPRADIHRALAELDRPRKHYQWYYSTRAANLDLWQCPQGVHAFLRAYYHQKSADWPGNQPFPLKAWQADELAKMPTYYIMDFDSTMPQTVAEEMPSAAAMESCHWLTDSELSVYSDEYSRTGFQGGLQWYRYKTGGDYNADLRMFSGRTIDVPATFIAGRQDWGVYQIPGAFNDMRANACRRMREVHLIDGAGHWVQQEQAGKVTALLIAFLQKH